MRKKKKQKKPTEEQSEAIYQKLAELSELCAKHNLDFMSAMVICPRGTTGTDLMNQKIEPHVFFAFDMDLHAAAAAATAINAGLAMRLEQAVDDLGLFPVGTDTRKKKDN